MKLSGCVVLYNPKDDVFDNIMSYIDALDVLYLMDNSEQKNEKLIANLQANRKCRYIDMKGNKGIALALNRAWKRAYKNHYEWLLTMDQDSALSVEDVATMKRYIEDEADEKTAIVCARYLNHSDNRKVASQRLTYLKATITSGSIMNVSIAKELGGFESALFIDEVDHEYCFHAIVNGYKIVRMNNVVFKHCLGDQKMVSGCRTYNYSPVRNYYYIRNSFYVMDKYKDYEVLDDERKSARMLVSDRIVSVLYEKQVFKKYAYMLLGYLHYRFGKLGKM